MILDLIWAQLDDLVGVALSGAWRNHERDVAIVPDGDGRVRRQVVDVIIPASGPAFTADSSRPAQDYTGAVSSDAEVAGCLMVAAVSWLPRLVDESDQARAVLKRVRDQLDPALRTEVDALLAKPTVREEYDGRHTNM